MGLSRPDKWLDGWLTERSDPIAPAWAMHATGNLAPWATLLGLLP